MSWVEPQRGARSRRRRSGRVRPAGSGWNSRLDWEASDSIHLVSTSIGWISKRLLSAGATSSVVLVPVDRGATTSLGDVHGVGMLGVSRFDAIVGGPWAAILGVEPQSAGMSGSRMAGVATRGRTGTGVGVPRSRWSRCGWISRDRGIDTGSAARTKCTSWQQAAV